MTRNKRSTLGYIKHVSAVLTFLTMILGVFVIKEDWMYQVLIFFFSIYAFAFGYTRGWDDREKQSSKLKGP